MLKRIYRVSLPSILHRKSSRKFRGLAFGVTPVGQLPHRSRPGYARSLSSDDETHSDASYDYNDLNHLYMLLKKAVEAEDYASAAFLRDRIHYVVNKQASGDASDANPGTLSWSQMGILDWLVDRAIDLGYGIPTPVQSRAGAAVVQGADCIIVAPTGSGKTLAFLLPLLSTLKYPPETYPDDLDGPQLVVVVPTRELGAQIAMIVYKLFGGSVASGVPGHKENMFRYSGPRGLKVRGLILDDEVDQAVEHRYLEGAHVVIGTPPLIAEALARGVEVVQHCRGICFDEADACFKLFPDDLDTIFKRAISRDTISAKPGDGRQEREKPITVLSGATLSEHLVEHAIQKRWLLRDTMVEIRIGDQCNASISTRIRHRYVVVEKEVDMLGALCRLILADQKSHNRDAMPTRGIIFVKNSNIAKKIAEPLRNIFWGKHSISVLLPHGSEPIKNLHAFRDNKTTLLIATSSSSRGLDLPAVTHVYSTFVPSEADTDEYVHMAGRLGRIGADDPGIITTILVRGKQMEQFLHMLIHTLGIPENAIEEMSPPVPRSITDLMIDSNEEVDDEIIDDAKRALETILAISHEENEEYEGDT